MSEHSRLSASASKKWLHCSSSLMLEKLFEDKESSYAKQGTIAHALGELKIKLTLGLIKRSEYISERDNVLKELSTEDIQEMDNYTNNYKDFVFEVYNSYKANYEDTEILIEKRLDYSKYAQDGFGTGDIVISDYDTVEIIDLKYGKGVKVDAFENSQLMLYGLGALEHYDLFDIKKVNLTIYQPRLDHIDTYSINSEEFN